MEFFRKKLNCREQQSRFSKAASVPSNAQLASYKVAYRVAQCKKPHTIAEELILPAALDMVSTMINEATAIKLKAIPLSNNTIARCIDDMSKDIEELNDKMRESRFALQMDEATVWNKERLLITYVRFIDADDLKEDLLFCKQITSRATADELFQITDTYLKEEAEEAGGRRRMDGFSRMLAAEGSRQRRWNWMPATALLMEDGCNFLDSKQ